MAVSPKVSASTVGAAFSTMIVGILGQHVFPANMAPDVQGLITAGVTALVTFGAGWFARELPAVERAVEPEVKAADIVYTKVRQEAPTVEAVAKALDTAEHVTVPVAQAVAKPLA
jgi:hypothetical protein